MTCIVRFTYGKGVVESTCFGNEDVMLQADERSKYRRSGEIAKSLKKKLLAMAKPNCPLIKLAETAEVFLQEHEMTVLPAFPLNISVDEVAAHFSPLIGDRRVLPKTGVVKLDLGVQVDGYISDTAISIDLDGRNTQLIQASKAALNAAIEVIRDGVTVKTVSAAIEETIEGFGFRPIYNLTGHKITRFNLHGGVNIPNTVSKIGILDRLTKLREDDIFAIEPFATAGVGYVIDGGVTCIYQLTKNDPVDPLLQAINNRFDHLPFSPRWIPEIYPIQVNALMQQIKNFQVKQFLDGYPELVEKTKAIVSQAEHTIRVTQNGCEVLT